MQKGGVWIAYYKSDTQPGGLGLILQEMEQNGNSLKINYRKISQTANGQGWGRDALAFLKEEKVLQREGRQWEYEAYLELELKQMLHFVPEREWEEVEKKMEGIMEKVQDMAFMEGYRYAVAILNESMADRK